MKTKIDLEEIMQKVQLGLSLSRQEELTYLIEFCGYSMLDAHRTIELGSNYDSSFEEELIDY